MPYALTEGSSDEESESEVQSIHSSRLRFHLDNSESLSSSLLCCCGETLSEELAATLPSVEDVVVITNAGLPHSYVHVAFDWYANDIML